MKKLMLSVAAVCTMCAVAFAFAPKTPPAIVENTFKATYKSASNVTWVASASEYTAKFLENGIKKQVVYSKSGKLVLTKSALTIAELPTNVTTQFATAYKGQAISEACLMTKADGTKQYLVESAKVKAIYSEGGKFVKMEKKGGKEEEGEEEDDD